MAEMKDKRPVEYAGEQKVYDCFKENLPQEVILEKDIPSLTKEFIKEKMNGFLGDIEQVPPMTSAIHVNGKKLYEKMTKFIYGKLCRIYYFISPATIRSTANPSP